MEYILNKFIRIKGVIFIVFLASNLFSTQAQTYIDTLITKHPDVEFQKYDSLAEILFVINGELNINTRQWNLVIDIYGENDKIKSINKEYISFFMKRVYFENVYKKQIEKGDWVKGDTVKNGYWIQFNRVEGRSVKIEGFVVNSIREGNWKNYIDGYLVSEGIYKLGIKNGTWDEWIEDYGYQYKLMKTGCYINGKKNGQWKEYYYPNRNTQKGVLKAIMFYSNDLLEGNYKSWWTKKDILEKGIYVNGLRDGKWVELTKKDTSQICYWDKGVPIKVIIYIHINGIDDPITKRPIPVPYEVKLIKWEFKDDIRFGEWQFVAPPIDANSQLYYDCWGVEYHKYMPSSYYYLGTILR
ncbi:MAG: hypothetical protein U0U66_05620 [Cytophagaceae bacterium]